MLKAAAAAAALALWGTAKRLLCSCAKSSARRRCSGLLEIAADTGGTQKLIVSRAAVAEGVPVSSVANLAVFVSSSAAVVARIRAGMSQVDLAAVPSYSFSFTNL